MTALTPAQKERQRFARSRAGQIRFGMQNYIQTLGVIAQARAEGDHLTLGYESWQAYVDGEFGDARIQLPPDMRRKAIDELRLAGATQREIGHTLGVSASTVNRELAARVSDETRDEDEGAGQSVVDAMKQALVDADERAQDHREPVPGEADGSAPSEGAAVGGPAPDQGEVGRSSHKEVPTSPTQDPSHAQGFSGEEAGTSAGTDVPAPDPGVAAPVGVAQASPAATSGGPGPVMPPAGPGSSPDYPCEKCGADMPQDVYDAGFTRCADCDPDGEHQICRPCGRPL